MFNQEATERHIGKEIKFRERLKVLAEVETYVRNKCIANRIEFCYDCTADENTYFKTINYTTYNGLFIMHPLNFSQQLFQMFDAKADGLESAGHVEWIEENLKGNEGSKYTSAEGEEFKKLDIGKCEAVLVMAGSNKCYEHTSSEKLKHLVKKYGERLVIKPHPITTQAVLDDLASVKGDAIMADRQHDLYDLIGKADKVYTTHISETALTSLLLGKKISPMEVFKNRMQGSFFHINHFCFSEPEPVPVIKSIFASAKSGIVHPEIDADWKKKVDDYFDYILEKRAVQAGHYLQ